MGIKIIGVKIVGLCSKCRKEGDEIPKDKFGKIYDDKDISCLSEAFGGNCNNSNKYKTKLLDICPDCGGELIVGVCNECKVI